MATRRTGAAVHSTSSGDKAVAAFEHSAKCKNVPAEGLRVKEV